MNARDGGARESLIALLVAALLVVSEVWLFAGTVLFTRPLWLDEIHTVLVASRQDVLTSMKTLAAGADFNPPTLFLLYRGIGLLTGGLSVSVLRAVALATVVATIPVVYWLLRQQFGRWASATGALAVWAQSVVVTEAFDARFYGPWLLGAASLALAAQRTIEQRPSRINAAFLAGASMFVCTIHYFGILSWSSVMLVAMWFGRETPRQTSVRLWPALAGPIGLTLCVPFYVGQRAALSTATWIPELSLTGALFLLGAALIGPPVAVALIGWAATRFVERRSAGAGAPTSTWRFVPGPAMLLSQGLVPVAIAIFSLAVQPAMQPRYSVAAALVAAPVVAACWTRSTRMFRVLTLASAVVWSVTLVTDNGRGARERVRIVHDDVEQVARIAALDSTVVVRRRHSLYPILLERPDLAGHAVLFDGSSVAPNDRFAVIERDVARVHEQHYGFPRIIKREDLDSARAFYFLELDSRRTPTSAEFPGRHIDRVGERLFRIERECDARRASALTGQVPPGC